MAARVFGIGFHKTGTTSLGRALEILGYRVCGPVGYRKPDIAETLHATAYEVVDDYDAFHNNPWALIYRDLDARFPGSRFILTVRDTTKWYASVLKHFGETSVPMREVIYGAGHGAPAGNEAIYRARYERHNAEVMAHFAGRSDFAVMDLSTGAGWDVLCPLLGKAVPDEPFPHLNLAPGSSAAGGMPREEVVRRYGHLIGGLPYGKENKV